MIFSKTTSRLISFLMVVVMLVGMFPMQALAAEGDTATVNITSAKNDGNFADVTITAGQELVINLTNGSSSNPKNYTVTVGDDSVAQVTSDDSFDLPKSETTQVKVKGLAAGETTVVMEGTGSGSAYTATINLTVTGASEGGDQGGGTVTPPAAQQEVAITASSDGGSAAATIAVGEKLTVKITNSSFYNAKTFSGESANTAVATVESGSKQISGGATGEFEVTGVANGTTTITFTGTGSGSAYTATLTLTVGTGASEGGNQGGGNQGSETPAVQVVEITTNKEAASATKNVSIEVGESFTLKLKNASGAEKAHSISNTDSSVASVDASNNFSIAGNGTKEITITGLKNGKTTITFTGTSTSGSTYYAVVNVTVGTGASEGGNQGGGSQSSETVSITSAKEGNGGASASATIAVGQELVISLTNGSSNNPKNYTVTVDNGTVAEVTSATSFSLEKSATTQVKVKGLAAGTTKVVMNGAATSGSSQESVYVATINLTVTGGSEGGSQGGTETPPADGKVVVIAGSDMQAGTGTMVSILDRINNDYASAYGVLMAGDYSSGSSSHSDMTSMDNAFATAYPQMAAANRIYVQGNHDSSNSSSLLASTGNHDTAHYGVYVIRDRDFGNGAVSALQTYLNDKITEKYTKPIFVVTHKPLHDNPRGDNTGGTGIFSALNDAGQKGLNIIFLFGHNHSGGYDAYLGNGSIYLKKGDSIKVPGINGDQKLNFTYMTAGYVGYISGSSDTTLTMTTFEITDDEVIVKRYDTSGLHNLKAAGAGGNGYTANSTVYQSPQTIALDGTVTPPVTPDEPDVPDTPTGKQYLIISEGHALTSNEGEKYTNSSTYDYYGFNGVEYTEGMTVTSDMLWTIEETTGGYYIMQGGKYLNGTYGTVNNRTEGRLKLDSTKDVWAWDGEKLKSTNASAAPNSAKYLTFGNGTSSNSTLFTVRSNSNATAIELVRYNGTGETPSQPGQGGQTVTDAITLAKEAAGATITKEINVGDKLVITLTNPSGGSKALSATIEGDSSVATVDPSNFDINKNNGTKEVTITGKKAGNIKITLSGQNTAADGGTGSIYYAVINLTVKAVETEHPHTYGAPTYTGDGKTSYVATRECTCGDKQTATAAITSAVTTAATCTAEGVLTYTANFAEEWAADKTTTEAIAKLDHDHSDAWSKDATGHWHECTCGDKADFAEHKSNAPATETAAELCAACGWEMSPILGHTHKYGDVSYTGDGKTSYVATRECTCGDKQTATATITSAVTTEASCTTAGVRTYTANFAEEWAEDKTTTEAITKLDHNFVDGKCSACGEADPDYDEDGNSFTKVDAPTANGKYVIVIKDGSDYYSFNTTESTSTTGGYQGNTYNGFEAVEVTVSGNKVIDGVADDMIWNVTVSNGKLTIRNDETNQYLAAEYSNSNSQVRKLKLQSSADNSWTYTNDGFLQNGANNGNCYLYLADDTFTVRSTSSAEAMEVYFYLQGEGGSTDPDQPTIPPVDPDQPDVGESFTKVTSLTNNEKYVIVVGDNSALGTTTQQTGTASSSGNAYIGFRPETVTISGNKITSGVKDDMIWTVTVNGNNLTIKNDKENKYLVGKYGESAANQTRRLTLETTADSDWQYKNNQLSNADQNNGDCYLTTYDDGTIIIRSSYSEEPKPVAFYLVGDGEVDPDQPTPDVPSTEEVKITTTKNEIGVTAKATATIRVGETLKVTVTSGSGNERQHTLSVDKSGIVELPQGQFVTAANETKSFNVKGLKVGTAVITLTSNDHSSGNSIYYGQITVTVIDEGGTTDPDQPTTPPVDPDQPTIPAGDKIVVISGSDYQDGNSGNIMTNIMKQIKKDYPSVNGILMGGDYSASYSNANDVVNVDNAISSVYPDIADENRIYVQGNHDEWGSLTPSNSLITATGAHDTDYYGVYSINYADFSSSSAANALQTYLNGKTGSTKPIFVITHQPLHASSRGDNTNAVNIFNVLNEAGKNLNIIFLFGHNHSSTYDDYLGGGSIYLKKGDSITVEGGSRDTTATLNFTYLNCGYVGYINGNVGKTLTMTAFEITDTQVIVKRYSANGTVDLKVAGSGSNANTTVYESPQIIALGGAVTPPEQHKHELQLVSGQEATCTVDGWNDYYQCECGDYFADAAGNNEITDLNAWKTGAGRIPAAHIFDEEWKYDDEQHWHECECGEKNAVEDHNFTTGNCVCGKTAPDDEGEEHVHKYNAVVTEPTCTETGYTTFTCSCGDSFTSNTTAALGHDWDDGAVTVPTCTGAGYTTYTCEVCEETYTDNEVAALGHNEVTDPAVEATCTTNGLTEGKHCSVCEVTIIAQTPVAALGHKWDDGVVTKQPTAAEPGIKTLTCTVCDETQTEEIPFEGQMSDVLRISGKDRVKTALSVARALKDTLGVDKFDSVIIATGVNEKFADALSGSYLANMKNAPILLYTNSGLSQLNVNFIKENLKANGTVYILGGDSAVPVSVEETLAAYNVVRLSGKTRYETNLAILKEAGISGADEILVATGTNFADSLSASAVGLPLMLVNGNGTGLNGAQIEFLKSAEGKKITIIGGDSAVSEEMKVAIEAITGVTAERISGKTRHNTSVLIAQKYFPNADFALITYAKNFPDGLAGGPLAYAMGAPLLLTNAGQEGIANGYITAGSIERGYVLGGDSAVSDETARKVFGLAADAAIEKAYYTE